MDWSKTKRKWKAHKP